MGYSTAKGATGFKAAQLLQELQRLEHTNTMLAEEARIAKDALRTALDKLGFDWSPASRDYTIMCKVLAVASLPEVERTLQLSEERRIDALQTIVQLRHAVKRVLQERNEVLLALVRQFETQCYRCTYLDQPTVLITTPIGEASWSVDSSAAALFDFLPERPAPSRVLADHERSAALALLD